MSGTRILSDGTKITGTFDKEGFPIKIIVVYKDGNRDDVTFVNGVMKGTRTSPEGIKFVGTFDKDGRPYNGTVSYKGQMVKYVNGQVK